MMPRQSRFSQSDLTRMVHLYSEGKTTTEIASLFQTDSGTVSHHFKKMGVTCKTNSELKRKYALRDDAFSDVLDERTAYWLGFLFADGSVSVRRNGSEKSLRLTLQERDLDHLRNFASFMGTDSPLRSENNETAYGVSLYSHRLVNDLIHLGCIPGKSTALFLNPPSLALGLMRHFVRGYFDGDGSAYLAGKQPNISFCGNPQFLTIIQGCITMSAKVDGLIYPHSRSKNAYYLCFRGAAKCIPLGEWLYRDATVFLPRKRDKTFAFSAPEDCGSAGNVSAAVIQRYIEAQKGRE